MIPDPKEIETLFLEKMIKGIRHKTIFSGFGGVDKQDEAVAAFVLKNYIAKSKVQELQEAVNPLIEIAESYVMSIPDRYGVTRMRIDLVKNLLKDLG